MTNIPRSKTSPHMCMQIFFPCSKPTPDMSFPLVHIKNFPHLNGQCRVDHFQPFHAILMFGCH